MKSVHIRNKAAPLLACAVGCLFILAGCSSDDDAPIVDALVVTDVTVSGTVLSFSDDAPLPGVSVEGVYTSPGDVDNPTATTDAAGAFSLTVKTNTPVYLHGTLTGYATINSEKGTVSASESGEDIEMPTETEAQDIINAAFPTALPQLANHAWLAVDVYDTNGVELGGKTISSTVTPDGFAYIDCTGAPSTTAATVACTARDGVMYLAYFGSTTEATVTVDGINKIAPLNLGEVTVLDFELAAVVEEPPVDTPSAGQLIYDAQCASCHSAGSYDTDGAFGDVAGTGSQLQADVPLTYLAGSMTMVLTQQEVDDLANFLDVEILP